MISVYDVGNISSVMVAVALASIILFAALSRTRQQKANRLLSQ